MNILNLTQHQATQEQIEAGVVQPAHSQEEIINLLTYISLPSDEEIKDKVDALVKIAVQLCKEQDCVRVLLGGAPYILGYLEFCLTIKGLRPVYAFTTRVSEEETLPTGEVVKVSKFKHLGFVGL